MKFLSQSKWTFFFLDVSRFQTNFSSNDYTDNGQLVFPLYKDRLNADLFNHNYYNFLKCDWCISCIIFHYSLYTVVIGQCIRTVGCNQTPVIGQLKQPIILSPLSKTQSQNWSQNHSNNHLGNFQNGGILYFRHPLYQRCLT